MFLLLCFVINLQQALGNYQFTFAISIIHNYRNFCHDVFESFLSRGGRVRGGGTSYNGLYWDAPHRRGTFSG